jgi:antitoxin component YwqK of YwqJK toxin-antitoxin module
MLREHKIFHDNDKLYMHYFSLDLSVEGEFKRYNIYGSLEYIHRYNNNVLSGYDTHYHDNGKPKYERFYKNGKYTSDHKEYDFNGSLVLHEIEQCVVKYKNSVMIQYYVLINNQPCYMYNKSDNYLLINLPIINMIRYFQKKFRKRMRDRKLSILDSVIGLNVISLLILSY